MTWTSEQADKARRLLDQPDLSPEKRSALQAKLSEFSGSAPSGAQSLSSDPGLASAQAKAIALMGGDAAGMRAEPLPARMQSGADVPALNTGDDFERARLVKGKGVQRTPEEEIEYAKALRDFHIKTYNDEASNASKLRELDLPPEYTPPTASFMDKVNPVAWNEPSVEQFMADMANTLDNKEAELVKTDPESSHAYKIYRDRKWKDALEQAQQAGTPIVRVDMTKETWKKLLGNAKEGTGAALSSVASGLTSGGTDFAGKKLEEAGLQDKGVTESIQENERAYPLVSGLGEAIGYLHPRSLANATFGAVKSGLGKVAPNLSKVAGGAVEATAAGAIAGPAVGAGERLFSGQEALDPDRMAIEALLGGGLGLAGQGLGWLPGKGAKAIESGTHGPAIRSAEKLGVRLGPAGGVNLPPNAKAVARQWEAMPQDGQPGSVESMLVDRMRPKYAEAGLRESDDLTRRLQGQDAAYYATPEGKTPVQVERTLAAAKARLQALTDQSGRPLPGAERGMALANDLEQQLLSLPDNGDSPARTLTAQKLDEFISWVDDQANVAKRTGGKDPLYEDFVRATRQDRQQFGANEVTDRALGADTTATLGSGDDVTGYAAMKAKQETEIAALDRDLVAGGLPREFRGREPGFDGRPGPVRLDPKTEIPELNNALSNAYKPRNTDANRLAVEKFARKGEVYDDLRALGATEMGTELRNMGRLFGSTTHSGARYGRIVHTALPWLRAMASDGRLPSNVIAFVKNLRSGLGTAPSGPGGLRGAVGGFKSGYSSPLPGPGDFAARPLGSEGMAGVGLRGGGLGARGYPLIDAVADQNLGTDDDNAAATLTEEDVVNLARLIESTRPLETNP